MNQQGLRVRFVTSSAEETRAVAALIGRTLKSPLAVLLSGDYGAGKTTFVQGLAAGLGVQEPVRSPSYNILRRYEAGARVLLHADLYRVGSQADIDELAIPELLPENGVLAVEWPAGSGEYAPDVPQLRVDFIIPPTALNDGGEAEPRELQLTCDERCPIALIEVLIALSDS